MKMGWKNPSLAPRLSHFALYVGEKLDGFNKRQRMLAEKRINDVLYEIESAVQYDGLFFCIFWHKFRNLYGAFK